MLDGNDIKKAREAAKIKQDDLASAMGLSFKHTLVDIEAGKVEVTESYVLRALGIIGGMNERRKMAV